MGGSGEFCMFRTAPVIAADIMGYVVTYELTMQMNVNPNCKSCKWATSFYYQSPTGDTEMVSNKRSMTKLPKSLASHHVDP